VASDLKRYHAKRKFHRTPEPKGTVAEATDAPMFCIQQHHARRMHYDLRLQIGGTLRSWAVPEGPCLDPKVRRFAKLTEDHPLEYLEFEGQIPDGNYGAGNMIVWDRGTWVTLADDPDEALKNGELKFRLAGEKLSGGWTLVQLPDDPTNFLFIKERDIAARPLADYDVLKEEPNSVITGLPVDAAPAAIAPAAAKKAVPVPKAGKLADAKAAPFPSKWSPELASQADLAPRGQGWLHEIKYDGYRTLVMFDRGKVTLITRNGHDWTKRYGSLAKAFAKLPCETAILDGEIVVQDARGISSLNLLEEALSDGGVSHTFTFFAFDLCYLDGHDLSGVKLIERKRALEGLVTPLVDGRSAVQLSTYVEGDGQELFTQASRMGLEGIVSKKTDSRYVQKRSNDWVKVKRVEIGTFTVIGFLSSAPKTVTSLLLAEERADGLEYACRVGSGISETRGRELYPQFAKVEIAKPVVPVPKTPDAHWIEPNWTIELGYRSRSSDNAPRAPVFMSIAPVKKRPAGKKSLKPKLIGDKELASIHLTNPEREMFNGSGGAKLGVTKLDIALFYARVGDWLLPELLRRPVTIIRCPTGDIKDLFYQRHAFHGLPDGVAKVELKDEEGRAAFITVTEPKGYLGLPQFGAVEFHLWGCKVDDPEHPDRIVMDLDPDESLPWSRVCDGAEILRDRMKALGFEVFLRTTGGKGLHLVTAIDTVHDWKAMKSFAEALAKAAAGDSPSLFTAVASKERRKGKIYIDYLRNGRGASAIASYSLRARPNFPVATPIRWDELRNLTGGAVFDRQTVFKRLETLAADPWDGLESSAIKITPQMRRSVGLKS